MTSPPPRLLPLAVSLALTRDMNTLTDPDLDTPMGEWVLDAHAVRFEGCDVDHLVGEAMIVEGGQPIWTGTIVTGSLDRVKQSLAMVVDYAEAGLLGRSYKEFAATGYGGDPIVTHGDMASNEMLVLEATHPPRIVACSAGGRVALVRRVLSVHRGAGTRHRGRIDDPGANRSVVWGASPQFRGGSLNAAPDIGSWLGSATPSRSGCHLRSITSEVRYPQLMRWSRS